VETFYDQAKVSSKSFYYSCFLEIARPVDRFVSTSTLRLAKNGERAIDSSCSSDINVPFHLTKHQY
jgi:hypothetical protein